MRQALKSRRGQVRALQVAAQAAGVFVAAAQLPPRRIIFIFQDYDDAKLAADICRAGNWRNFLLVF
jgi:hypothetical protein